MSNQINTEPTIGEIVANDFRAASMFKEAGIDFCCGGNKSLTEACREKGADESHLIQQLDTLAQTPVSGAMNFKEWDLGFLSQTLNIFFRNQLIQSAAYYSIFFMQRTGIVFVTLF